MDTPYSDKINEIITKYQISFPVSVIGIANELGIQVYQTDELENNISGFITKEDNKYEIYVNKKHPATRKQFTIAHELAHFILHKDIIDSGNQFITYSKQNICNNKIMARSDNNICNPEYRIKENQANKTAANLLMPEDKFIEVYNFHNNIQEVASYFGVSYMAASIRASQFGEFLF